MSAVHANEAILIYTMGKVGTNSIVQAIRRAGLPVYNGHTLNKEALWQRIEMAKLRNRTPITDLRALDFLEHVEPHVKTIRMVTSVRESVGRNMSGFFQTLWRHGITPPYEGVRVEDLIKLFFEKFNHQRPDQWFRQEFRKALSVDPFHFGFDPSIGFLRFRSGRFEILFVQIELGAARLSSLISEFLGSEIIIGHTGKGQFKQYGSLYDEFKRKIVFPEEHLQGLMESRVMQSFYTEKQRQHVMRYYLKEIPALHPFPTST